MESLAIVVESMTKANKTLRDVIEKGADEVGQLEKFEDQFRSTRERFLQFKETILGKNQQADELLARLNENLLEKRQAAEEARRQIAGMKHAIVEQSAQNQKLEHKLDEDVARLTELKSNGAYMNSPHKTSTRRLERDPQIQY